MRFHVRHVTRYSYTQPVFLEPYIVRMRPREDAFQRLREFALEFDPEPVGLVYNRDLEGNVIAKAWFEGVTQHFRTSSLFDVETTCDNAFELLLRWDAARLPLAPDEQERHFWPSYSARQDQSPQIEALARQIAQETDHGTLAFCSRLALWICDNHEKIVRRIGPAWSAHQTLRRREGSCRDLAVLFIEVCRAAGIPTRFVSGYAIADQPHTERHMHAWGEVYLPGAGWRGFDPSLGLAVADGHVAVAAARTPAGASPSCGSFRSNGARSALDVQIVIRTHRQRQSISQEQSQGFIEPIACGD